jgi:fluoride exporter
MVSSPVVVATLPLNILAVNVVGSFVLGVFSILSVVWNLDTKYFLLIAVGFCGSLTTFLGCIVLKDRFFFMRGYLDLSW